MTTMSFTEVLAILVDWLGRELEVSLHGANGASPTLAAELKGRLRRGDELSSGSEPADALLFVLEGSDGQEMATFVLSERAFKGASWFDTEEDVLEIRSGVIQFLIALA